MFRDDDNAARQTARFLEVLLSGEVVSGDAAGEDAHDGAVEVPAGSAMPIPIDPALARAARRLRADLVPVHPSFGFERALAAKLAWTAREVRESAAAATHEPGDGRDPAEQNRDSGAIIVMPLAAPVPASHRRVRPLIVGGVAASALSIGAVFVAWRLGRPASVATAITSAAAAAAATTTATTATTTAATTAARSLHRGKRNAVLHGILGVVS